MHCDRQMNQLDFDNADVMASAGFWLGGQCPLAARGEENFENLTTKWCILKYI